jgi:hypothetical protein
MTDEDLQKIIQEMEDRLGTLPNPDHEPKRFAWYIKLYNYFKTFRQ